MAAINRFVQSALAQTILCCSLWTTCASAAEPRRQLLFVSQGKTARINVDGSDEKYFDFSVPDQATWQPGPVFPDGKRLMFLSIEPRRYGPGKPFDEYYHQTPTHLWIHHLATGELEEICTKERMAPYITPALLLGDERLLIQVNRNKVGQVFSVRLDGSDPREFTRAGEGLPYGMSLSPNQKNVAFHLATADGYQVWTADVNGGQRRRVAANPNHLYFGTSWSPDGQSVLCGDGIWVVGTQFRGADRQDLLEQRLSLCVLARGIVEHAQVMLAGERVRVVGP